MFFADRIVSIRPGNRVLEVGPGGAPHPRSDVLLERRFGSPAEAEAQRGGAAPLGEGRSVVYYDGGRFPFADGEFDYVICSHVLEHVGDVDAFAAELSRVAGAGYLEYPTVYYDYLYNFDVHLNLLHRRDGTVCWMPKSATKLGEFKAVQDFFYESLAAGHEEVVVALKPWLFEGFEWRAPLRTRRVERLEELCLPKGSVPVLPGAQGARKRTMNEKLKGIARRVLAKTRPD